MSKSWIYKQKYYRDSLWNKFQEFMAFQVIPFAICSIIAAGIVLALFSPLIILDNY